MKVRVRNGGVFVCVLATVVGGAHFVARASADIIALSPNIVTGTQTFDNLAGEDFTANQTIAVTQLGVFDNHADGVLNTDSPTQPVVAQIWNVNTGVPLATLNFGGGSSIGTDTSVGSGKVFFKSLSSPLILQAGSTYYVSVDYSGAEGFGNHNDTAGDPTPSATAGSAITFPSTNGGRGSNTHGKMYSTTITGATTTSNGFFDNSSLPYTLGNFQFNTVSGTATPINISTGWNARIIKATNSGTLDGFDGNEHHNLVAVGGDGSSTGLPVSGAITMGATGDQFQLQSYAGYDGAQWTAGSASGGVTNNSVQLTLATPASYSRLSFLAASGNGGTGAYTGNITLNFVGGSSTTYTSGLDTPDWVAAGGSSVDAPLYQLPYDNNGTLGTNIVGLGETTIGLSPSDQGLLLQSITFSGGNIISGSMGAIDDVVAVSGVASSVPEPASLAVIGLAAITLLARQRRI
jgi:hypothetical protein